MLEWKACKDVPDPLMNAQAVSVGDKLYIGGCTLPDQGVKDDQLYVYSPISDIWKTLDTPVYWFGLTTYHSRPALVGGMESNKEYSIDLCTNKLWTLNEHELYKTELQPMKIRRYMPSAVSYEDYLLVAGGFDGDHFETSVVEVYNGSDWSIAHQPLPQFVQGPYMKSACLAGYWYLGGFDDDDKGVVYYASLDSLIDSSSSTVWKRLPDIYDSWPSVIPVVFRNNLIALGASSTIYAFSFHSRSWEPVGSLHLPDPMKCMCSLTMRSGELIVVGEVDGRNAVLKATDNCKLP